MHRSLPEWRLPPGVSSGLWDYANADHIAEDYDEYFAYNLLFQFDESILDEEFQQPGRLVDLGCGTGRLAIHFAARGFHVVAIDLSLPMLRVVGRKAFQARQHVDRLLANMVQLECVRSESIDYCICMFSTLGMTSGGANRLRVLQHVRRMLKPGGQFALHVHNRWYNLFDPQGRVWLARTLLGRDRRHGLERGDKVFDYRAIPNMRLHLFSLSELRRLLRRAGFRVRRMVALDTRRQRPLPRAWWFGRIRANGWIAFCD
jgi:SAM-dependent methyltransferase